MDKNVEDLNGLYLVNLENIGSFFSSLFPGGGGVLPYITYTGMCRLTGSFNLQTVLERSVKNWPISRMGYQF